MQTTIIQRVEIFSNYKKITIRKLSQMINFNYTTLNNYLNGRRSAIDIDLICKLMSSFDDINIEWLLLGKGNMLKETKPIETISNGHTMEMLKMISELSGKIALLEKELNDIQGNNNQLIAATPKMKYGN